MVQSAHKSMNESREISRRGWLLGVVMTGLAGLAGWAGRQALRDPADPAVAAVTLQSPSSAIIEQDPAGDRVLLQNLAQTRGENMCLEQELASALAELESLRGELQAYRTRVVELDGEKGSWQAQAGALSGLITLYQQLDGQDLDGLIETGLAQLAQLVAGLVSRVPFLREGLSRAIDSLDALERSLPTMRDGLSWLELAFDQLARRMQSMEDALAETVEPLQPVLQKVADFFARILGWIPFGIGDRVGRGLEGIQGVLTHIPEIVSGAGDAILDPLRLWLDTDPDGENSIQFGLIAPLRSEVLTPAGELIGQADNLELEFQKSITPAILAQIEERRRVRQEIARYRELHGIG